MIRHACGLFGVSGHQDAARHAYFGLYAQQHRGQEGAGIVTWDGGALHEHRGTGLVPDVFNEAGLQNLPGDHAIGHVLYGTSAALSLRNTQPFTVHHQGMDIALAHNGKLVNSRDLRRRLEENGAIFQTARDVEVFMHLIIQAMRRKNLEEAVLEACSQVRGSYSLVLLVGDKLIGLRDPLGIHPLALGRLEAGYALVSETCALDLLEAEFLRAVEPGEMAIIQNGNVRSMRLAPAQTPKQCVFELMYFGRPDSLIFDEQVYLCRKRMGWQLAFESTPDVDFVMPFPDSGVYAAVGFAQGAELPYEHAMIRNHYVGRTFIQPTQGMRNFSVRVKINPVRPMIEGKRICIVDDSIVRGTTMLTRVKKLRELGAREVHIRISCPPVRFPCCYGIDFASRGELIAAGRSVEEIRRILDVDSLHYLSLEGLARSVAHPDHYCRACLTGDYPVPPAEESRNRECGAQ
ncbi:MAG: amidophosphoribosyltransferase [Deltaproteobacteria bacterium]|jgi:amidophosphoribosyltransferase|nr:amidophosphoribosyltransferase [Deltaproteobacteria bacterium]